MKYVTPYNDLTDVTLFLARARQHLGLRPSVTSPPALSIHLKRKTMNHYRNLFPSLLLATGLSALAAGPALADCHAMGGHEMSQGGHAKRMEQRHQQLHDALKLTPEQEGSWKKLMDAEQHKPMRDAAKGEDWSKLSTPERAEKMLELSKQHQAQMSERVAALKGFYATLTPEQQKTFDQFHAAPKGRMGGKPGPHGPAGEKGPVKP